MPPMSVHVEVERCKKGALQGNLQDMEKLAILLKEQKIRYPLFDCFPIIFHHILNIVGQWPKIYKYFYSVEIRAIDQDLHQPLSLCVCWKS
ncbi:hypothetical protein C8J56DRAFT_1068379 [Mycena floridula]|nr:hypothetical protein C8J56DRAFT_1068379 [Mycena floridula]